MIKNNKDKCVLIEIGSYMDGILVVNKEKNKTSRDIVNDVSKILGTRKIGHTGTLDPLATGVLVLCIGKCTKLAEIITAYRKQYVAEVELGVLTDTLDVTGNILKKEITHISKEKIEEVLKTFQKTYIQTVPIYSAVKVNGKKLYEYARKGESVTLPEREVSIYDIHIVGDVKYHENKTIFSFWCDVSKGTYIRSLIYDIALALRTVGTMKNLCRVKQGTYLLEQSFSLEDIQKGRYKLQSIEDALYTYIKVIVPKNIEKKIKNGQVLENIYQTEYPLFISENGTLLALYKPYQQGLIKPFKMFV